MDAIDRIIAKAVTSIETQLGVSKSKAEGTLAIIAGFLRNRESGILKSTYGEDIRWFRLNNGNSSSSAVSSAELLEKVEAASRIIIVGPSISQLRRIVAGEDDEELEKAAIKALLWGKQIEVLPDFVPEKAKRMFKPLDEALNALEKMGVRIITRGGESDEIAALTLVTEKEIVEAMTRGASYVRCAAGAIVTPLATDKARVSGIEIERCDKC